MRVWIREITRIQECDAGLIGLEDYSSGSALISIFLRATSSRSVHTFR